MKTTFYRSSLFIAAFFAAIFLCLPAHSQQGGGAVDRPNDRTEYRKIKELVFCPPRKTKTPAKKFLPSRTATSISTFKR